MKLPMKIRVGYRTIEIAYAKPDFKRDNMTDCFGQYLDRENRIEIQPGLSPKEEANTVLHEIMHCVFKTIGEVNDGMALSNDTTEEIIPNSDLVINLTPDKNHTPVVEQLMPLMKKNSILSYSHGFNIVEEGIKVREDITVIMVAPKSPGSEVREEYLRGFGVPTLIAVHPENDANGIGFDAAKAYAVSLGSDKAGVLESSFVAEVKSDLMGEQTILCGMLQTGSILCFNKMKELGVEPAYSAKLIQYGWETITEALKLSLIHI